MTDDTYPERRAENFSLQKQVNEIDGKIGRVETKIETFTTVLDERWQSMELRIEWRAANSSRPSSLSPGSPSMSVRARRTSTSDRSTSRRTSLFSRRVPTTADDRFNELKGSITWMQRLVISSAIASTFTLLGGVVLLF
jgi:hypothetical protein